MSSAPVPVPGTVTQYPATEEFPMQYSYVHSTDSQRRRRPTDHEWIGVQMRDAHKFLTKAEAVKFAPLRVHRTTKYHPALEYFQKHSLPRAICDEGIHVERAGCKRACGREHVPGICGGVDGVKLKRWRAYNNGGWRRG